MLRQLLIIQLFQIGRQASNLRRFVPLSRFAQLRPHALGTFATNSRGRRRTKPLLPDGPVAIRAIAISACFNPRESVVYVAKPPLLLFVQSLKHACIALLLRLFL